MLSLVVVDSSSVTYPVRRCVNCRWDHSRATTDWSVSQSSLPPPLNFWPRHASVSQASGINNNNFFPSTRVFYAFCFYQTAKGNCLTHCFSISVNVSVRSCPSCSVSNLSISIWKEKLPCQPCTCTCSDPSVE